MSWESPLKESGDEISVEVFVDVGGDSFSIVSTVLITEFM